MSVKPRLRFYEVVVPRFEWSPKRGVMATYYLGQTGTQTRAFFEKGLSSGAIILIPRPKGVTIGKDGRMYVRPVNSGESGSA